MESVLLHRDHLADLLCTHQGRTQPTAPEVGYYDTLLLDSDSRWVNSSQERLRRFLRLEVIVVPEMGTAVVVSRGLGAETWMLERRVRQRGQTGMVGRPRVRRDRFSVRQLGGFDHCKSAHPAMSGLFLGQ